jgi:uncharacterized protein (DUF1015 family)
MADIRPFQAYRPKKELASQIAALPYDVYNREEAKQVVEANPQSFLGIDRAETQFGPQVDTYDSQVYAKAAQMLWERIGKGDFIQDEIPCYYLYRQIMNGRVQRGIVACASIDDYLEGTIKKHENTRADKEEDRIRHVDACDAQTGPIFLAYRSNAALNQIMMEIMENDPIYDFCREDGIQHTAWLIDADEWVTRIQDIFKEIPSIYIADGHHRCASAVKVGLMRREENPGGSENAQGEENTQGEEDAHGEENTPYNFFLSVLFPDEDLKILDYNRVVKDLNGLSVEDFLAKVEENFTITKCGVAPCRPLQKGTFGMFLKQEDGKEQKDGTEQKDGAGIWYELKAKEHVCCQDAVKGLDVSVLQNCLLEPILGIHDPKTDKRIDFVGGIRGLDELERRVRTDMQVAFALYPTSIGELFAVADNGLLMPPKSTWFEPKLLSGLFIHSIK